MSEDIDYEPDVLKFKQVWNDNKNPDQTAVDPKNLQTIESNNKNGKKKNVRTVKPQTQDLRKNEPKTSTKKHVETSKKNEKKQQHSKPPLRNPKPQIQQVIQISTKPTKFYHSSFENQKNNIAKSHLYLDHKNNHDDTGFGFASTYDIKKALEQKDYELSMLRVSNSRTEDRVRYLERQLEQKNQVIAQLRERERKNVEKHCSLQSKEFNFDYGKAEYENFRNDSRRLLKMLQATSEYQDFAKFALDDDGVRFLHQVNKSTKSKLDNPSSKNMQTIHFCTCNKQFIPQSGFWVPEKVYSFGKEFIKQRKGEMTEAELQLLLYELNRIWREREKRIVNTHAAMKAHEVGKYKRKVKNLEANKQNRARSVNQQQEDLNENEE